MNRDVRFSNDKSPYKTAHAAMAETDGGSAHYVQISKDGLFAGGGMLEGRLLDTNVGPSELPPR